MREECYYAFCVHFYSEIKYSEFFVSTDSDRRGDAPPVKSGQPVMLRFVSWLHCLENSQHYNPENNNPNCIFYGSVTYMYTCVVLHSQNYTSELN
jgi:hypothetical protein